MLNGKNSVDVFTEFLGESHLAERIVNLFAPDFICCRTDVTTVAEESNHVVAAYVAQLQAALNAFETYKNNNCDIENDVLDDLYANLAVQYAQLSLSTIGNKIFDEYECGGIATAQPYLSTIDRAERLFDIAENIGNRLWAKYRKGVRSYGRAWQNFCCNNKQLVAKVRSDLAAVVGQKRGVLRLRLMLPDTYSSIRAKIFVRYVGQDKDTLLYRGSTKTMLTMFDISGEYVLRFATDFRTIEYVLFSAYGEGAQYPVYAEYFDGTWLNPQMVEAVCGTVKDEQNILQNNLLFATLGTDDGRKHLDDMELCKQRNAVKIVF